MTQNIDPREEKRVVTTEETVTPGPQPVEVKETETTETTERTETRDPSGILGGTAIV